LIRLSVLRTFFTQREQAGRAKAEAREEASARARAEAEELARRQAEERARHEASARARKEAEELALRREQEERARREAEERARREAEERGRREEEERARRRAEEEAAAAAAAETAVATPTAHRAGRLTAVALYDYQAAEDNEISFAVGETIIGIEQIDENWWQGSNAAGQSGLFPAAYVQLNAAIEAAPAPVAAEESDAPGPVGGSGLAAVALYDYDAGT